MKNSQIFTGTGLLKQIPATVCHKSGRVHNQKSKWQSFEYWKNTKSRDYGTGTGKYTVLACCLLYTSDAADE